MIWISNLVVSSTEGDSEVPLTSSKILMCSGSAKMVASIATYPHEVVRTRLQTQRRPLVPANYDSAISSHAIPAESAASISSTNTHAKSLGPESRERGGLICTTKRILRREGWRGLYKGLSVNLIRTVPNSAVTMLTYVPLSQSSILGLIYKCCTT